MERELWRLCSEKHIESFEEAGKFGSNAHLGIINKIFSMSFPESQVKTRFSALFMLKDRRGLLRDGSFDI